jgi:hypothetical protein
MKRDDPRACFQLGDTKSVNGFVEAQTRIDCIIGIVYYFVKTHGVPSTCYNNLKQLAMSIQKHEISTEHVQRAALKFKLLEKQQSIAGALDSGHRVSILRHNKKVKENRDILKRLVDMTLYLSTQELAFVLTMKQKRH